MDDALVSIGEFSRMTHLSAKALRLYHREGILVPAVVDATTGYRWYGLDQLAPAQVVRRLRTLDLPLPEIRAVLDAPSSAARGDLLSGHLARKEAELAQARDTVDSLRRLLGGPEPALPVDVRLVEQTTVIAVRATIALDDLGPWWTSSHRLLDEVVVEGLPAAELAVAAHEGPDVDADRVYAALGRYVTERAIGVPGPVRETYLSGPFEDPAVPLVTEIGWPIFATAD